MITASEVRKIMKNDMVKTYPKDLCEYYMVEIEKEIMSAAKPADKNTEPKSNCSFWFDINLIKDPKIKEKYMYCMNNDLFDSVVELIMDKLSVSGFICSKMFKGISISW